MTSATPRAARSTLVLLLAVVFAVTVPASAATYWAENGSGNWDSLTIWSSGTGAPTGDFPDDPVDVVTIANARTVTFNIDSGPAGTVTIASLEMGNSSGTGWKNGSGVLQMRGGKLIVTGTLKVRTANTTGTVTQTAGHLVAGLLNLSDTGNGIGSGNYNFRGGILEIGAMVQTGSANDGNFLWSSGQLIVDASLTANAAAGTLTARDFYMGHNAGSNVVWTFSNNITAKDNLRIGNNGNATFTQTGGIVNRTTPATCASGRAPTASARTSSRLARSSATTRCTSASTARATCSRTAAACRSAPRASTRT
jgi:hypothetical protein